MVTDDAGIDISASADGGIVLKGGENAGTIVMGDGQFFIQNSAEVTKLQVAGTDGDLWTTGSLIVEKFAYVGGALQVTGAVTAKSTFSGSGAASFGAGATMAGALNMQAGGITNAGAIAGATTVSGSGLFSPAGGINVAELFTVSTAGATVVKSTISGSGALSVGAGATPVSYTHLPLPTPPYV